MQFQQLSFLSYSTNKKKVSTWKLCIDGASRNNPGPAGAGICVYKNENKIGAYSFYLGIRTNNQAEYLALLLGIYIVKSQLSQGDTLLIQSDSQLVVQQIKGIYKVKDTSLQQLHTYAYQWLSTISFEIYHVMREENSCADRHANEAIDKRIPMPVDFIAQIHGI